MSRLNVYQIIIYCNALIWFVNGLLCKVINLVPRHEQIIAQVFGDTFSRPATVMIGISEIVMCLWVLLPQDRKFNIFIQIATVLLMNIIEFIIAPDLLLWGRFNILFALLFSVIIYYNEFVFNKKLIKTV